MLKKYNWRSFAVGVEFIYALHPLIWIKRFHQFPYFVKPKAYRCTHTHTAASNVRHRCHAVLAIFSICLLVFDLLPIPVQTSSFSLWTIISLAPRRRSFVAVAVVSLGVDAFVDLCKYFPIFFFLLLVIGNFHQSDWFDLLCIHL